MSGDEEFDYHPESEVVDVVFTGSDLPPNMSVGNNGPGGVVPTLPFDYAMGDPFPAGIVDHGPCDVAGHELEVVLPASEIEFKIRGDWEWVSWGWPTCPSPTNAEIGAAYRNEIQRMLGVIMAALNTRCLGRNCSSDSCTSYWSSIAPSSALTKTTEYEYYDYDGGRTPPGWYHEDFPGMPRAEPPYFGAGNPPNTTYKLGRCNMILKGSANVLVKLECKCA